MSILDCLVRLCVLLAIVLLPTACTAVTAPTSTPLRIRCGFGSEVNVGQVPTLLGLELLGKMGYDVEIANYAQAELAVEALSRGDADFGSGSLSLYWSAAGKGGNSVTILSRMANDWQLCAVPELRTCADLQGSRVAQHGAGSVAFVMTEAYIAENCPGTEPQILIIPGSANRAAALLAGQVDAATLKLTEVIDLQHQAPGRFHTLANFGTDLPRLLITAVNVNRDFAARHPEAVRDFIKATLTAYRQIQDDPAVYEAAALRLAEADPETLPDVVAALLAMNAFDANGGLTVENLQYSLDYYTNVGELEPGLTVTDVADLSYLEDVLDEMGRR